jgi:hypothetical protein
VGVDGRTDGPEVLRHPRRVRAVRRHGPSVPVTGLVGVPVPDGRGDRRRAASRRWAIALRWLALSMLVTGVAVVAVFVAVLTGDGSLGGVRGLLTYAGAACCPWTLAVVTFAASRLARRAASEEFRLAGTTLVATDALAGRREYDLLSVPVSLVVRRSIGWRRKRRIWAELRIADDPAERRVIVLSDRETRRVHAPDEVSLLAAVLARSPRPESRIIAGRLRTLARWGSLAPLRAAEADEIPIAPAEGSDSSSEGARPATAGEPAQSETTVNWPGRRPGPAGPR